jgi:phosphohistidine phosphatase SixA
MTEQSITGHDLAQPRNARELEFLSTANWLHPTIEDRARALALEHSQGRTMPATGASPAAQAAWNARQALASAAVRASKPAPKVAPVTPSVKAVVPVAANPAPASEPAKPVSYVQQLRDALAGKKLTPAARAGIRAELVRLGG